MKHDVIIIGAGLGGLTAGAVLAKEGKKVLILEQHSLAGGCATVYTRKGIRFEVGLHEMDWGKPSRDMKHLIFEKLGILNSLPLVFLPQVFTVRTETEEYTIPEGIENAKKALYAYFPEEKKGIHKYFSAISSTMYPVRRLPQDLSFLDFLFYPITSFPIFLFTLFRQDTVGKKCDEFFTDTKIKNILNANVVYFHDDPTTLSWFFHSSAQNSYYNSAVFIKGGSQVLSNMLGAVIEDNGGQVCLNADVIGIELQGNVAVGVKWRNKKGEEQIEYGTTIIANCAIDTIYDGKLLPKEFSEPRVASLKLAISLYTVYIIFKKSFSSLYNNTSYSTFVRKDANLLKPLSHIKEEYDTVAIEERDFVFVDYSVIDSGLVPEGDPRSFGVLTGGSYLHEWEALSKEEYRRKKEYLAERLFERMGELFPNFADAIEYYEVSTPKTIKHYIRTPEGTAYGFEQTKYLQNSRAPRKATQIKNLYYTGAWTFPGGGFTGAIISGYMTAQEILMPTAIRMVARIALVIAICTAISIGIGIVLGRIL